MKEKKKIMTLEEFANYDFMKRDFKENIDVIKDIQDYCQDMIGVTLTPDTFNQLKNIDINLLKVIALAEREIGYENA